MPRNMANSKELVYKDYLCLNKILDAQHRETEKEGRTPHHDEHFFIIIHQVFELWFKEIIFELKSIMKMLKDSVTFDFKDLFKVNERMTRIITIQKLLMEQLEVMETLQPASFIGFRSYLFPASGFQSYQFRILENMFGLKKEWRSEFGQQHYKDAHSEATVKDIEKSEKEDSFLSVMDTWLVKVFGQEPEADRFWRDFEKGVKDKIEDINKKYSSKATSADVRAKHEAEVAVWKSVIEKERHDQKFDTGDRRMSFGSWKGALLITYNRNKQEKYSLAYRFLNHVRDADSLFMKWRYHHVKMVHRMIGNKSGTGGTQSGYGYLKTTVGDEYQVFRDLFDFQGFLLEPDYLPQYSHD